MDKSYTTSFTVDQTPEEVFAAVTNPRGWWSEEIEGDTDKLGSVFDYHFEDVHRCKIKITEFVPGKKVVWHVVENYMSFIKDKTEWVDTEMIFDISQEDGKTKLQFTHKGLVPAYECYEVCSNAWPTYINSSMKDLIVTGKGHPNATGRPATEDEKAMTSGK